MQIYISVLPLCQVLSDKDTQNMTPSVRSSPSTGENQQLEHSIINIMIEAPYLKQTYALFLKLISILLCLSRNQQNS